MDANQRAKSLLTNLCRNHDVVFYFHGYIAEELSEYEKIALSNSKEIRQYIADMILDHKVSGFIFDVAGIEGHELYKPTGYCYQVPDGKIYVIVIEAADGKDRRLAEQCYRSARDLEKEGLIDEV